MKISQLKDSVKSAIIYQSMSDLNLTIAIDIPEGHELSEGIVKFFDTYPQLIRPKYLSNFYTKCPGSSTRVLILTELEEEAAVPLSKFVPDPLKTQYSELRLSQSSKDFYDMIDKAILEVGLNYEMVKGILDQYEALANNANFTENQKVWKNLSRDITELKHHLLERLLPVYKTLREWGYRHQELVT